MHDNDPRLQVGFVAKVNDKVWPASYSFLIGRPVMVIEKNDNKRTLRCRPFGQISDTDWYPLLPEELDPIEDRTELAVLLLAVD